MLLSSHKSYAQTSDNVVEISQSDISTDEKIIYITDSWLFKSGDNEEWASPSFTDTTWQKASTYLGSSELGLIDWNGIGWFRFHFKVDSSLVNHPLALIMEQHNGASEIYLDGQLLYEIGEVSTYPEKNIPKRDNKPRPLIIPDTARHVLAVRFANYEASTFEEYNSTAGFRFLIGDLEHAIDATIESTINSPWWQLFFAGGLIAFTVIHFLLYVFYPSEKQHLYFAIFTFFLAALTYSLVKSNYSESPLMAITLFRFSLVSWLLSVIYALRFSYSLLSDQTPRQFWVFLGVGLLLAVGTWFNAGELSLFRELFVLITLVEISRVLTKLFSNNKKGVLIIGGGLAGFAGGIFYTVLTNLDIATGDPVWGNIVGSSVLILSMSIYLSRDFAQTQQHLKEKLKEVQRLSEKSLKQERINKQKELERKLLEAENERKSQELEKARTLQLSMLPKQIPQTEKWDIAVFMETAQEVGGDYYDFSISNDGTLTVALGDATGHGMKAGIMVATAKSYFHTLANDHDNLGIIERMSSGIRNMDLHMMYMGLMLMKCKDDTVQITSAGMPPCLWYRGKENRLEEILLKGMPLGSKVKYPYKNKQFQVQEGDTLVLMSDGLMELFNEDREQLGLERIKRTIKETVDSSASDILTQITKLKDQWSGSKDQEDDITVLVMKAKQ
ncbi:PP2C family protein-serine/threonine phosphatase [Fodinibius halophilus]|uniref:SpoIIE family protein phosphatase n=1 Tax=Fodinibius halophilus TaxID=1736908 RepID=A0A6M1T3T8_9BACT|nr:SpoIIE family protein phosphatase [Fodinibius halophilus]NGP87885.1 SpoIIE family protein phosphatase [Fodinibius halophilus]